MRPEEKSERRDDIVAAARSLLLGDPHAGFPIDAVARAAGLAKGTLYLYFRTREEVLLAAHEAQVHELFDIVERALGAPKANASSIVGAGLGYLHAHSNFYPLAGNCRSMLDTKVGTDCALAFKVRLGRRLAVLGSRIEVMYPGLASGQGAALLMNSYALMIGLWQQADPPACLREAMRAPEMRIFRIDFEAQLAGALNDLWDAAQRRSRQNDRGSPGIHARKSIRRKQ